MSFQQIHQLDYSLALDPATKPEFLSQLRHALVNVGFFLLVNFESAGPSQNDRDQIAQQAKEFFELSPQTKYKCEMIHSPHFLGYTRLANEITDRHTDWREQIDLATELPAPKPDEPVYRNVEGPNLWPDEREVPQFKPVVLNYIEKMTLLATAVRRLASESIGLEPNAFDRYFKPNQQCKMKLIAYPDFQELEHAESVALDDTPDSVGQGCGPHRDLDFLTYIFQASGSLESLQVQNFEGQWITVPVVANSLVVNVGQTLESISKGVCKATIHRVLIPKAGLGTRISIPFFQTIDLDSTKGAVGDLSPEVVEAAAARDRLIDKWGADVGFQFTPGKNQEPVGWAVFHNRIKSHQDVAKRWYPDILTEVLAKY